MISFLQFIYGRVLIVGREIVSGLFLYLSSIVTAIFAKSDRKRSYTQKS